MPVRAGSVMRLPDRGGSAPEVPGAEPLIRQRYCTGLLAHQHTVLRGAAALRFGRKEIEIAHHHNGDK